ncbi:MAG TPA: sigma-70 family RNA polymerase sigma factor [Nitrospiraceae bacterium]|nr:sigma-70 family RNA polymerase sigma factor [Nitrospiraceae bacterium]
MDAASRQVAVIDPKLLSRVAKGDLDAFGQLYDQSSVLLFTLAHRILGNRDEAAQLLQDVYLEVWRKVARYDVGRGTPVAWLVTLTRSRAIERVRSGASQGSQAAQGGIDTVRPAGTSDIDDHASVLPETKEDRELRLTIAKAVAELPAAQREAIELAYYNGLSHTEIATKLHQPLGTVKTRIKLAMVKLRALLQSTLEQSHPG